MPREDASMPINGRRGQCSCKVSSHRLMIQKDTLIQRIRLGDAGFEGKDMTSRFLLENI